MSGKIALILYLALNIIKRKNFFSNLGQAVTGQTTTLLNDHQFDWTEGEKVTLREVRNDLIVSKKNMKNSAIIELCEPKSNYSETFTIATQSQKIEMSNEHEEVSFDLLQNKTSLRSSFQPARVFEITGPNDRSAKLANERGYLSTYYDVSVIGCEQEQLKAVFKDGNLYLITGKIEILYYQFEELVKIYDDQKQVLIIDLERNSIEGAKGEKFAIGTRAWRSAYGKVAFSKDQVQIIYGDVFLKINLPHKSYGLVLSSPHANLSRTPTSVRLACDVGVATMALTEDENAKMVTLTSYLSEQKSRENQIYLRENFAVIRGPRNRITIKQAPKIGKALLLKTMYADLMVPSI